MEACYVRPAVVADAEAAIDVIRSSIALLCVADHQNDRATLERWLSNKTPEMFAQWVSVPDDFVAVGEIGGVLRGVSLLRATGDLNLFYVQPGFQRCGVGSALIGAIEERARTSGHKVIRLRSSADARAFYERHGYISSGPRGHAFGAVWDYPYEKDVTAKE